MSRPGDLSIASSALNFSLKNLRQHWEQVQAYWDDPVSRGFEKEYIAPLEPEVATVLKAVGRLSQVMGRAYEECS